MSRVGVVLRSLRGCMDRGECPTRMELSPQFVDAIGLEIAGDKYPPLSRHAPLHFLGLPVVVDARLRPDEFRIVTAPP